MTSAAERVASRYADAVVTKVTPDVLEKWKKDLRMLTKIYKAVGLDDDERDRESWFEARDIFKRFSENFEKWTYKVLLPRVHKSEQSYLHKEIATKAWTARAAIDSYALFPDQHDGGSGHGRVPAPWKLRHERDKNITRYQKAFNDAFKTMEAFIESNSSKMERAVDEVFNIAGMQVVVHGFGRSDERQESDLDKFLRPLSQWASQIERAGFQSASRGLKVFVDFDGKDFETNASYSPDKDQMTMFGMGLAGSGTEGTFTHEVGHRFWFREVSTQGRAHWVESIESRGAKITQDDIDRFHTAMMARPDRDSWGKYGPDREVRAEVAKKLAKDEIEEAKFEELARGEPSSISEDFSPTEYKKRLGWKLDEIALIDNISEYAASGGPIETFAEVFRKYVTKGPGSLPTFILQLFKNVCRSGGARLASTDAERLVARFQR